LPNKKKICIRTAHAKDGAALVKLMKVIIEEGPFTLQEADEYKATAKSEAKEYLFTERQKVKFIWLLQ